MMELFFAAAAGAILGGVIIFLVMRGRAAATTALLAAKTDEQQRAEEARRERELQQEAVRRTEREAQAERELALNNEVRRLHDENKESAARRQALERELFLLREQMQKEGETQQARFDEQLKMVREQLQNATQEMLRQRAQELSKTNTTQLDAIINPLKDTIRDMKTAMDNSRDTHNKNTASLERAIEEMMKKTGEIGLEADKLAHALRNESKVQGNWGELILDELLAGQGLVEGTHYEKQVTLRDSSGRALLNEESGKRMIPDTVLHYPDGKDAILDSKVSLTAFVDYQNAETDEAREEALARHIKSLRQHVTELVRKDYSAYVKPPRQALNYVIMFVPNESALQLALCNDTHLWREAFEKGVFITSEQNLMAALRMIQLAWAQVQQAQNQELIFDAARMLLDRVADFLKFFDDVGERLDSAAASYKKAADKLRDGRQSVVGASQKLIRLGAKTSSKKTIPDERESLPESRA